MHASAWFAFPLPGPQQPARRSAAARPRPRPAPRAAARSGALLIEQHARRRATSSQRGGRPSGIVGSPAWAKFIVLLLTDALPGPPGSPRACARPQDPLRCRTIVTTTPGMISSARAWPGLRAINCSAECASRPSFTPHGLIKADASRQKGVEALELAPEVSNRAIDEYLAVLDDAAFHRRRDRGERRSSSRPPIRPRAGPAPMAGRRSSPIAPTT